MPRKTFNVCPAIHDMVNRHVARTGLLIGRAAERLIARGYWAEYPEESKAIETFLAVRGLRKPARKSTKKAK